METINGCVVIVSSPINETRRIILAVRFDGQPGQVTYITAAAQRGAVDHWDHGRYFTARTDRQQASALEQALENHAARVTNSVAPPEHEHSLPGYNSRCPACA